MVYVCTANYSGQNGLALTTGAEVALEALAEARRVVTDTTARAIPAEVVALAEEHISTRWALFERTVRTTGAKVAHAANVLVCVPGVRVGLGCLVGELFLLDAAAAVVAVGRADGTLAGLAVIVVETFALASLAVASTLHRAFHHGMRAVVRCGVVNPGLGLGAGADGAVMLSPGRVAVLRASVARALVVVAARAVATAAVRAVGGGEGEGDEEDICYVYGSMMTQFKSLSFSSTS